jgi:hypothetical protein
LIEGPSTRDFAPEEAHEEDTEIPAGKDRFLTKIFDKREAA